MRTAHKLLGFRRAPLIRVLVIDDLHESRRVPPSVTTFCSVPHMRKVVTSLWFVTVVCFRISRSSRELAVLLFQFQLGLTAEKVTVI